MNSLTKMMICIITFMFQLQGLYMFSVFGQGMNSESPIYDLVMLLGTVTSLIIFFYGLFFGLIQIVQQTNPERYQEHKEKRKLKKENKRGAF